MQGSSEGGSDRSGCGSARDCSSTFHPLLPHAICCLPSVPCSPNSLSSVSLCQWLSWLPNLHRLARLLGAATIFAPEQRASSGKTCCLSEYLLWRRPRLGCVPTINRSLSSLRQPHHWPATVAQSCWSVTPLHGSWLCRSRNRTFCSWCASQSYRWRGAQLQLFAKSCSVRPSSWTPAEQDLLLDHSPRLVMISSGESIRLHLIRRWTKMCQFG